MDVVTNEREKRFEIVVEGQTAVLDYEREGDRIVFTHTGVPRPLEGRGIGTALAKAGLEFAKDNQLRVVPACSFIAVYIRRHPEYQSLVA
jgi:uncharacterized protein